MGRGGQSCEFERGPAMSISRSPKKTPLTIVDGSGEGGGGARTSLDS